MLKDNHKLHPAISIITPSLNAERVLTESIQSVRNQTVDCEHILIDGGSSDGTLELVNKESTHFSKIVSEADNGIYAAMNKGIKLASGEIIGVLNADDFYVSENVLEQVLHMFSDPEVDACYGDLEYVARDKPDRVVRRWQSGNFTRQKFFNGWMPPHPTLFFRRTVYDKYGLYLEDFGTSADYEFMVRVFVKHGLEAKYIPHVLVRMRVGGVSNTSITARWKANRNDAFAWKLNDLEPRSWTLFAKPIRKIAQWLN